MRRIAWVFGGLCLLWGTVACPGSKPLGAEPAGPADSTAPGTAGAPAHAVEVADRASELMPEQTQFWAEVRSARRLTEMLERDRFESRMPTEYRTLAGALTGAFGTDILDADNLPQLGLDPDGELGFFVLDGERALGMYARINDTTVLRESIAQIADRANVALRAETNGGVEVFRDKYGKYGIVVREPFVFLVATGSHDRKRSIDWLDVIAKTSPKASLATRHEFQEVLQTAADDDDVWAYINPMMSADKAAAGLETVEPMQNWAEEELARAKQDGATAERIAELEKQVAENEEFEQRYRDRHKAEADLLRALVDGTRAIGVLATMKPRGPRSQMWVVANDEGLPRQVLHNRSGPPVLVRALDGRPIFLIEASTERKHLQHLVDLFLRTESHSFDELMAKIEAETNLPVGKRLWPMLSGTGGFAVTLDETPDYGDPEALAQAIGIAAYLEVLDPDKAKAELDALMADARIDSVKFVKDRKTGFWSFQPKKDGKKIWRPLFVSVAANKLIVTTDPSLVGRIESGKAGKGASEAPDGAMAALSRSDQALTFASAGTAIGWLTYGFYSSSMSVSMVEAPEDAKVPFSRRYKAKKKELDKLQVKIDKVERRAQARAAKGAFELADAFGMTVWTVAEVKEGFMMEAGQYMRANSLVELAELAMAASAGGRGENDPDAQLRSDLWRERDRIYDELQQIRQEDLGKAR